MNALYIQLALNISNIARPRCKMTNILAQIKLFVGSKCKKDCIVAVQ